MYTQRGYGNSRGFGDSVGNEYVKFVKKAPAPIDPLDHQEKHVFDPTNDATIGEDG